MSNQTIYYIVAFIIIIMIIGKIQDEIIKIKNKEANRKKDEMERFKINEEYKEFLEYKKQK